MKTFYFNRSKSDQFHIYQCLTNTGLLLDVSYGIYGAVCWEMELDHTDFMCRKTMLISRDKD